MCHQSDVEMWKYFDRMHPDFAEEPRNVRLGLCIMVLRCTVSTFVLIHVGRSSLHRTIFPLLWRVGVRMYDHAMDCFFVMRVELMWTVNDLPTYGMASGWSTVGVMVCPVCMDGTRAFRLQHRRKACYFDCGADNEIDDEEINKGETRSKERAKPYSKAPSNELIAVNVAAFKLQIKANNGIPEINVPYEKPQRNLTLKESKPDNIHLLTLMSPE
ncbi:UNVERIFIED_CONTAM: hypothetical protein Scaly_3115900 [Sesamum calycinum]|uniref:Uncharacterized protein n=1 Tax=Sesamum calycinum TaxID=2727403 RepID=A0AAW2JJV1_9LAMI